MTEPQDLAGLTVPELRELARQRALSGAATMRKAELIAALCATSMTDELAADALATVVVSAPTSPLGGRPLPTPAPVPEDRFAYPHSYDLDKAVLLTRDPHWLFCYWDISGGTWAELERRGMVAPGSGWKPILRFHDVTETGLQPGPGTLQADLPVYAEARDWYIESPRPERVYLVEFGYLSATGEFFRVAVSNPVNVPRAAPSSRREESWGSLTDEAYRLSLAGSEPRLAFNSAEALRRLERLLEEAVTSGRFSAGFAPSSGGGRR